MAEGARTEEFELTPKDFQFIRWFIHKHAGISFSEHKRTLVYGRLTRQMRRVGVRRFRDYRELIETNSEEKSNFINALTTNKTAFFREYHHFEFLENELIARWKQQKKSQIRIWSAGCSTGEEPYSYAATLHCSNALKMFDSVSITATDLDTKVLTHAKNGIYVDEAIPTIPKQYLKLCFLKGKGEQLGNIKTRDHLRKLIEFKQLNLMDEWPFKEKFDLISCRNVMIYFDKDTQERLTSRFHEQLSEGGFLFIGHSEALGKNEVMFKSHGKTMYQKL
jgi:chemotaxis protein methyltransferase CheR